MQSSPTGSVEQRTLRTVDVGAVVVGGIIGVGIFFTPSSVARTVPSPAWVLAIWALGGAIAMLGAMVLADLGSRMPRAGGIYVFLREGFGERWGPLVAFLYAWVNLLVIQPAALAIIALVLVQNVEVLVGPLPSAAQIGLAMASIGFFAGANAWGLHLGSGIQRVITGLKLAAVAGLVGLGLGWGTAELGLRAQAASPPHSSVAAMVAAAMIPVLFSFGGWQHGTYIAGVARNPRRSVPMGIIGGVLVVVVCYLTINAAYLGLLGQDGMRHSSALAAEAASAALGPVGGVLIAAAIVVSAAGILNTISLAFPYVIYAMSRDGLFFEATGRLHPRTGTPALAVLLLAAWGCVGVLGGVERIDMLLAGTSFGEWAFFALVSVAHLRIRQRHTQVEEGFRVGLGVSVLFGVAATLVTCGALAVRPFESGIGLAVLVVGVVVYGARVRLVPQKVV